LGKQLLSHPVFGPAIFNGSRVVRFGQIVWHGGCQRTPRRPGNPEETRISGAGDYLPL
jgi:hypothetical protein